MNTNTHCQLCQLSKHLKSIEKYDEEDRKVFIKGFMEILLEYSDTKPSPWIGARANELKKKIFNISDFYAGDKEHYNNLILSIEKRISDEIDKSADPLKKAISYALIGNYIDFDAVKDVNEDKLFELINDEKMSCVDEKTYSSFVSDLKKTRKLVYLTDNCGEIVFDRMLIERIPIYNKDIETTVIVRGDNVINDATVKDARYVGLDKLCKVIGNGTPYASTIFDEISDEAKDAIRNADLIISKGQGNLEGFLGNGFNTYYMFLVKCDFFVKKFNLPRFTPVFRNEKDF